VEGGALRQTVVENEISFTKVAKQNIKVKRVRVNKDFEIKVLVLNARSIVKMEKPIELENYSNLHGYKIIAVTES